MIKTLIEEYISIKSDSYEIQSDISDSHKENESAIRGELSKIKKIKFLPEAQRPIAAIKILRLVRIEAPELSMATEEALEEALSGK